VAVQVPGPLLQKSLQLLLVKAVCLLPQRLKRRAELLQLRLLSRPPVQQHGLQSLLLARQRYNVCCQLLPPLVLHA
jgi:hypothetical protein